MPDNAVKAICTSLMAICLVGGCDKNPPVTGSARSTPATVPAALPTCAAPADDKKELPKDDGLKCVVDQFDKAWGIKFKSMTVSDGGFQSDIKITLDFTKDIPDVAALRSSFVAIGNGGIPPNLDKYPIVFYLFDEDNVSIGKFVIIKTEGDLTGVKGDAFRVLLQINKDTLKKGKKLEARLTNPPKAKE